MSSKIEIVAHPPERRRGCTTLLSAGSCCCCCCCLHSLGGVVGAIVGGSRGLPPTAAEHLEARSAERYAVKVYWRSMVAVVVLALIASLLENPGSESVLIALLVVALGLPAGQLAASVIALITLNALPHARKADSLRRLGRITLYSLVGGLIGTALMAAMIPVFK